MNKKGELLYFKNKCKIYKKKVRKENKTRISNENFQKQIRNISVRKYRSNIFSLHHYIKIYNLFIEDSK